MTDSKIVGLIHARNQTGISEIEKKYGVLMKNVAMNITGNSYDADECVNMALMKAWELLAGESPDNLCAYVMRIARNIAFDRYKKNIAEKRCGGCAAEPLDELGDIIPSGENVEADVDAKELANAIERFVKTLPRRERDIFVRRYWFSSPVRTIAEVYSLEDGNVRVILSRTREKLKKFLKEGNYL